MSVDALMKVVFLLGFASGAGGIGLGVLLARRILRRRRMQDLGTAIAKGLQASTSAGTVGVLARSSVRRAS